jgi:hypothetical protein
MQQFELETCFMQYHDLAISIPNELINENEKENENEKQLGIIKIKAKKNTTNLLPHQHIVFTIDRSGSMSYVCRDKQTKMEHIQFTLQNMVYLFSQITTCSISVHVNVFDNETITCIHNTLVTPDKVDELVDRIKKIRSERCTNIEQALKTAQIDIEEYMKKNPTHNVNHIFLTDGNPTMGTKGAKYLKRLVSPLYQNIFIGYGEDHDPYLMTQLANNKNGSYYFIDALEKASLVYGEIIHNILYKTAENTMIHMENAEIYNYNTNKWITELYIGNLVMESEKIFQIRSNNPDKSSFTLSYRPFSNHVNKATHNIQTYNPINYGNCIIYMFRQRTQELLYEIKEVTFKNNKDTDDYYLFNSARQYNWFPGNEWENVDNQIVDETNETNEIKVKTNKFLTFMKTYIKENNMEDDKFMKMLCDDLYISYITIGTKKNSIYTCARQTSQGRQTTYHVVLNNDDYNDNSDDSNDNNDSNNDNIDSPYATQGILETMRAISQPIKNIVSNNNNNTEMWTQSF